MRFPNWKFILASFWLLFTFSISGWWMIHGLNQAKHLSENGIPSAAELANQHRMFFWEGGFLLGIVFLGGASIFYLLYKDQKKNSDLRQFFSSFTHELKTSLTSLRLQAEILEEDPKNRENANLNRLLRDVVRLELQLENALILAQSESRLFLEDLSLSKMVKSLSAHWPQLLIQLESDAHIKADHRALECILKNLFQNAAFHGKAKKLNIQLENVNDQVIVNIRDDGQGFPEPKNLGNALVRHNTRSGSGVGLYLSKILAKRMGGELSFMPTNPHGLTAKLHLEGRIL